MAQSLIARGVFVVACASAAVAQTSSGGVSGAPTPAAAVMVSGSLGGITFAGGGPMRSVTGHPYSALEETQTTQTLADGTHITQGTLKVMYYRDSLGRTRTERTMPRPPGFLSEQPVPVFIEITDPVAGSRYMVDQRAHTAHRTPFGPARIPNVTTSGAAANRVAVLGPVPPPPALAPAVSAGPYATATGPFASAQTASSRPHPETSHESLGTQNFEGVTAEGTKTTTTWPIGFFGNDRPITTVTESWTSRELGRPVLTKTSDPRSGETTMRLTNISQAEPDASLFQIPSDYQIVDPAQAVK